MRLIAIKACDHTYMLQHMFIALRPNRPIVASTLVLDAVPAGGIAGAPWLIIQVHVASMQGLHWVLPLAVHDGLRILMQGGCCETFCPVVSRRHCMHCNGGSQRRIISCEIATYCRVESSNSSMGLTCQCSQIGKIISASTSPYPAPCPSYSN